MGRTNPTYRDRLDSIEREWQSYRRALRAVEQEQFDHLFAHGREYAHAAGYRNHTNPEIPLLLSILLAHERELEMLKEQSGAVEKDEEQIAASENTSEDDSDAVQD